MKCYLNQNFRIGLIIYPSLFTCAKVIIIKIENQSSKVYFFLQILFSFCKMKSLVLFYEKCKEMVYRLPNLNFFHVSPQKQFMKGLQLS